MAVVSDGRAASVQSLYIHPTAMEEAEGVSKRLQALPDEMEALQEEASARRLFDDDEMDGLDAEAKERQSEEEEDDDEDNNDKGSSSGSDDEKSRRK